jgi:hypothetical protein
MLMTFVVLANTLTCSDEVMLLLVGGGLHQAICPLQNKP